jgi:hypothetical protein
MASGMMLYCNIGAQAFSKEGRVQLLLILLPNLLGGDTLLTKGDFVVKPGGTSGRLAVRRRK